MRILHIPHAYPPVLGGAEHLCARISEVMAVQGHTVRVVTGNVSDVEGYYRLDIGHINPAKENIHGVEVRRLDYAGTIGRLANHLLSLCQSQLVRNRLRSNVLHSRQRQFTLQIEHEINSFVPDVVLAMPHLVVNVQCVLHLHQRYTFPLVIAPLIHPDWPLGIRTELAKAMQQTDSIVAATDVEFEQIRNIYHIPIEKVVTTWLGVDLPMAYSFDNRKPAVLFLGRRVLEKGIQELLDAMRFVWHDQPDAKLILAGARTPGTIKVDAVLDHLPNEERERIEVLDNISEQYKEMLLSTSSCLVLPSKSESFGLVLLEAMAHATPVVTLDLPVFRSIVTEGVEGFLIPPGDSVSLAKGIRILLKEPDKRREMGMAGRKKAERNFTWDKVANRYLAAYEYAIAVRSANLTIRQKPSPAK